MHRMAHAPPRKVSGGFRSTAAAARHSFKLAVGKASPKFSAIAADGIKMTSTGANDAFAGAQPVNLA